MLFGRKSSPFSIFHTNMINSVFGMSLSYTLKHYLKSPWNQNMNDHYWRYFLLTRATHWCPYWLYCQVGRCVRFPPLQCTALYCTTPDCCRVHITTLHQALLYFAGTLHLTHYKHNRHFSWEKFSSQCGEIVYDQQNLRFPIYFFPCFVGDLSPEM